MLASVLRLQERRCALYAALESRFSGVLRSLHEYAERREQRKVARARARGGGGSGAAASTDVGDADGDADGDAHASALAAEQRSYQEELVASAQSLQALNVEIRAAQQAARENEGVDSSAALVVRAADELQRLERAHLELVIAYQTACLARAERERAGHAHAHAHAHAHGEHGHGEHADPDGDDDCDAAGWGAADDTSAAVRKADAHVGGLRAQMREVLDQISECVMELQAARSDEWHAA